MLTCVSCGTPFTTSMSKHKLQWEQNRGNSFRSSARRVCSSAALTNESASLGNTLFRFTRLLSDLGCLPPQAAVYSIGTVYPTGITPKRTELRFDSTWRSVRTPITDLPRTPGVETLMKRTRYATLVAGLLLCLFPSAQETSAQESSAHSASGQETAARSKRPLVLVHYMPWYASRAVSGQWGWHWTMNHFDPDKVDAAGQPSAASHYRPLIGFYDSNDPDVLECQTQLMKLAGIDGVIVDWYGIENFRDYGQVHRNTQHLIRHLKKAGLKFAICYEDQSVKHMVEAGVVAKDGDTDHGEKVMRWMEANFFADDTYVRVDGKPLLLVFGPQHFGRDQWQQMTSAMTTPPSIYALPHLSEQAGAGGAFGWPPVHGGKEITPDVWRRYLDDLYARGKRGEAVIAAVFPQFHDIYQQAGLHDSYGFIDDRQGATFRETFEMAWDSDAPLIQIATWNDYGEGTMIEPAVEYGYRYLEAIQSRMNDRGDAATKAAADDLRLPVMLYRLRKQLQGDEKASATLDEVSEMLLSGQCREARAALEGAFDQESSLEASSR